jgi:S2P endopeptidase
MSIWSGLFLLATFWCFTHVIHHFTQSRSSSSLLPSHLGTRTRTRTSTDVSLNTLHLKISTTRWNSYHDKLSSVLARRGTKNLSIAFRWFYDLGSVVGALGMLVVLAGLVWILVTSGLTLFHKILPNRIETTSHGQPFFKRASESPTGHAQKSETQFITLIVSGHAGKTHGRF